MTSITKRGIGSRTATPRTRSPRARTAVPRRCAASEQEKAAATGFAGRRGEPQLILTNGERIAAIALYTGTNAGSFPPGPDGKATPATNKPIGMHIAHTMEFDSTGAMATR